MSKNILIVYCFYWIRHKYGFRRTIWVIPVNESDQGYVFANHSTVTFVHFLLGQDSLQGLSIDRTWRGSRALHIYMIQNPSYTMLKLFLVWQISAAYFILFTRSQGCSTLTLVLHHLGQNQAAYDSKPSPCQEHLWPLIWRPMIYILSHNTSATQS